MERDQRMVVFRAGLGRDSHPLAACQTRSSQSYYLCLHVYKIYMFGVYVFVPMLFLCICMSNVHIYTQTYHHRYIQFCVCLQNSFQVHIHTHAWTCLNMCAFFAQKEAGDTCTQNRYCGYTRNIAYAHCVSAKEFSRICHERVGAKSYLELIRWHHIYILPLYDFL